MLLFWKKGRGKGRVVEGRRRLGGGQEEGRGRHRSGRAEEGRGIEQSWEKTH